MNWPSMITQPSAAPLVVVAAMTTASVHGTFALAGVLVLIAAMTLGLAILGLATRD